MNDVRRSTNVRCLLKLTIRVGILFCLLFICIEVSYILTTNLFNWQLFLTMLNELMNFFFLRIFFCGYGIIKKAKKGNYTNGLITIFLDNCINIAQVVLFLLVQ